MCGQQPEKRSRSPRGKGFAEIGYAAVEMVPAKGSIVNVFSISLRLMIEIFTG